MLRAVLLILLMLATPATADARRRQINPVPFAHTPCSVLDEQPCTPSFCSIYGPWPCIPEM
ncbi:MAG: hypothetical protein E6417_40330, partial [Bradyrhizobium sp.]|nr:hypothetical protein [Bradyrhizobium sp.]